MIVHTVPTADAIAEIDKLIELYRPWRIAPEAPEHRTYIVLKALRTELQAETPPRIGEAHREMQASLAALERSKTKLGYATNCLHDVAYKVRTYWPTIRQALAMFEDARKVDAQ